MFKERLRNLAAFKRANPQEVHDGDIIRRECMALLRCLFELIIRVAETKCQILVGSRLLLQVVASQVVQSIHVALICGLLKIALSFLHISPDTTIDVLKGRVLLKHIRGFKVNEA